MGIYAYIRSNESRKYKALFVFSFLFAVFIKGISVLVLIMLVFLYWILFLRNFKRLLVIVLGIFIMLGAILLFDIWYQEITDGVGFWGNYISFQGNSVTSFETSFNPLNKIKNLIWYLGRAIVFTLPWIIFLIIGVYKSKKLEISLFKDRFLKFCLLCAILIILLFSLFDRKADRYIFSSYYFLLLSGAAVLFQLKPKVGDFLAKKYKYLPFFMSLILVIFTLLKIFFHNNYYQFFNF